MDFIAVTNQILEMDKAGRAEETIPLIRDMLAQPFKVPEVCFAAIVYSLYATRILTEDGDVKAKWEICQIDQSKPTSAGWVRFCENHLGMGYSVATIYRQIWEVFVIKGGCELTDLVGSGFSHLKSIVGAAATLSSEKQSRLIKRIVEYKPTRRFGFRPGFVYLINGFDLGFKIGRTVNLDGRLGALVEEYNTYLEVECSKWVDDYIEAERELHRRFSDKRRKGEWFDLSEEDVGLIWNYMRAEG